MSRFRRFSVGSGSNAARGERRLSVQEADETSGLRQCHAHVERILAELSRDCQVSLSEITKVHTTDSSVDFGRMPYTEEELMVDANLQLALPLLPQQDASTEEKHELGQQLKGPMRRGTEEFEKGLRMLGAVLVKHSSHNRMHLPQLELLVSEMLTEVPQLPVRTDALELDEEDALKFNKAVKQKSGQESQTDEERERVAQLLLGVKEEEQARALEIITSQQRLLERVSEYGNWIEKEQSRFDDALDGERESLGKMKTELEDEKARLTEHCSVLSGRFEDLRTKLEVVEAKKADDMAKYNAESKAQWKQIEECIQQIREIEDERFEVAAKREVEHGILIQQVHLLRKAQALCEEHDEKLTAETEKLQKRYDAAADIERTIGCAFESINGWRKADKTSIDAKLQEAHEYHLSITKSLMHTISEVAYGKEKMRNDLQEELHGASSLHTASAEMEDPAAKTHAEEVQRIFTAKCAAEDECSALKRQLMRIGDRFTPTAQYFNSRGIQFVNPLTQLNDVVYNTKAAEFKNYLEKESSRLVDKRYSVGRNSTSAVVGSS